MFKFLMASLPKNKAVIAPDAPKAEFINVPIQLLSGFLDDSRMSVLNIYYYSLYAHYVKVKKGTDKERYKAACDWYNFQELDREENLKRGRVLYERYQNSPMAGIERNLYSEYNQFEKTEFEKACFLAYHALKSIVGNKTYQKADNKLLWSRMDGKAKTIRDTSELSEKMRYFSQEYQTLKIKKELQENWGLVYYAQQTRGFYVSFKLDLKALITEVVKKKRKAVERQRLDKIRSLEKEVLDELNPILPNLTSI